MKLVFISDTHLQRPLLPDGDILIHSGDLTSRGTKSEVLGELDWLKFQLSKFKYVILVPGNHDFYFEEDPEDAWMECDGRSIHLLIHESITLGGINFFGSPYTPWFFNWAFNRARTLEEAAFRKIPHIKEDWKAIPADTNVLITHGPPYDILDMTRRGASVGCESLLEKIREIKPVIHVFGHIHEAYGEKTQDGTLFINASILDDRYRLKNDPIVIDYEELTREK